MVTADEQSAGRGRRGRVWSAPPGKALLYSAILRPLELEHVLLPLAVPVAVCEAIESVAPIEARLKWPNDVWIDEAKVAGVLIEARPPEWAVIGVGVNVSIEPRRVPRRPALARGLGRPRGHPGLDPRRAHARRSGAWVEAGEAEVLAEFRRRDALSGRELSWEGAGAAPGAGTGAGIDERGNLIVELTGGERIALGSGEVSLRLS